jgi:predicted Zn-dependent protease
LAWGDRHLSFVAVCLCVSLGTISCATSPLGRHQLVLFPAADIDAMGVAAFDQIKDKTPISRDGATNAYVSCVANAVTSVVGGEYARRRWEVLVFEDDAANAFALPGGKIGVYTGLLAVAENQDQLAAVIGHEVGHVLAQHSNERVSTSSVAQVGLAAASQIAGGSSNGRELMGLLGVGAQVGLLLPFSRTQETEADLIGLDLMAKAGFDPRASILLWRNMSAAGNGRTQPEFLSTHPSHVTRIAKLNERMPSALPIYERARAEGRRPQCKR